MTFPRFFAAGWGLCLLIISAVLSACADQATQPVKIESRDILARLESLPGIAVTEIPPENGFPRQFEIDITQPVDHSLPGGLTFSQRLYLSHLDESAPVVFLPSGYTSYASYRSELCDMLDANQIHVTHRYMRRAQPANMDWSFLTIEQAAADNHKVVELFKNIYQNFWVSYGRSKNGDTALFHRRHYPADVVATVALVAPLTFGIDDPRYEQFLAEQVGDAACREKIKRFQRSLLTHRAELLPMIETYMQNSPYTFTLGPGIILEYETCEFPFAFWQVTEGNCNAIPDTNATATELYAYLEAGGGFRYYSNEYIEFYAPVYYQMYTEQGYYRLVNDHLTDLLVDVPVPSYANFAPPGVDLIFKPEVIPAIVNWLQTEGNNIIYIYGGQDPWTAGAISSTGATNALKLIEPGFNHSITISTMNNPGLVYIKLEEWLGVDINQPVVSNVLPEIHKFLTLPGWIPEN